MKKQSSMKKMIQVVLKEISLWERIDWSQLETLKKQHPEYTDYFLESIPYYCGCYGSSCNCPREQMALKGERLETDLEFSARQDQETTAHRLLVEKTQEDELKLLADLKKKYPEK